MNPIKPRLFIGSSSEAKDTARAFAAAQVLLKANKECRDVFATSDGKKGTPAQRWITDDDILNARNG